MATEEEKVFKDINACVDPIKKKRIKDAMEERQPLLTSMDILKMNEHMPMSTPLNKAPFFFPADDILWNLPEANISKDIELCIRPSKTIYGTRTRELHKDHVEDYKKGWEYISVLLDSFVFGEDMFHVRPVDIVSNFSYKDPIRQFKVLPNKRVLVPRIVALAINHNCKCKKPSWNKLSKELDNRDYLGRDHVYEKEKNSFMPYHSTDTPGSNPYQGFAEDKPRYRFVPA